MSSSVRTEGRSETLAEQRSSIGQKEEKEMIFWDRSYGWDHIQYDHKGKSQKAVDTTGKLDTVFVNITNSLGENQ